MKDKKSLDQMAKNLTKCCSRSVQDVLLFLNEDDRQYLINKMEELTNKNC